MNCRVCEDTKTIEYQVQQAGEIVSKSVSCPICQKPDTPSEPVS